MARLLGDQRQTAGIPARFAGAFIRQGQYRRSRRYALYAYGVLRDTDRLVTALNNLGLVCKNLRESIPALARHFLSLYSRQTEEDLRGSGPEVMQLFPAHRRRGNVRELDKTAKRMVVLANQGDLLGLGRSCRG